MALTSEDITVNQASGWMAIVVTGTRLYISEIKRSEILVKFDIASTSEGFELNTNDTLEAEETIYVKTVTKHNETDAVLVVTRD